MLVLISRMVFSAIRRLSFDLHSFRSLRSLLRRKSVFTLHYYVSDVDLLS